MSTPGQAAPAPAPGAGLAQALTTALGAAIDTVLGQDPTTAADTAEPGLGRLAATTVLSELTSRRATMLLTRAYALNTEALTRQSAAVLLYQDAVTELHRDLAATPQPGR